MSTGISLAVMASPHSDRDRRGGEDAADIVASMPQIALESS
jgi:hypothetical protein